MKTVKSTLSGCLFSLFKLFRNISMIIFIMSFIVFIILSADYIYSKKYNIDITATKLKICLLVTVFSMFSAYSDIVIKTFRDLFRKTPIPIIVLFILISSCGVTDIIERGRYEYDLKVSTSWVIVDSVITGKHYNTYWTSAMPGRYYVFEDQELFQKGDTVRFSMSRCSKAKIVYKLK